MPILEPLNALPELFQLDELYAAAEKSIQKYLSGIRVKRAGDCYIDQERPKNKLWLVIGLRFGKYGTDILDFDHDYKPWRSKPYIEVPLEKVIEDVYMDGYAPGSDPQKGFSAGGHLLRMNRDELRVQLFYAILDTRKRATSGDDKERLKVTITVDKQDAIENRALKPIDAELKEFSFHGTYDGQLEGTKATGSHYTMQYLLEQAKEWKKGFLIFPAYEDKACRELKECHYYAEFQSDCVHELCVHWFGDFPKPTDTIQDILKPIVSRIDFQRDCRYIDLDNM